MPRSVRVSKLPSAVGKCSSGRGKTFWRILESRDGHGVCEHPPTAASECLDEFLRNLSLGFLLLLAPPHLAEQSGGVAGAGVHQ